MPTQIEKLVLVFKALSNQKRLEIMDLLAEKESLGLLEIAEDLNSDFRTTSEHCRRLYLAGLIDKELQGRKVIHSLTYLGRGMLTIARRTKELF